MAAGMHLCFVTPTTCAGITLRKDLQKAFPRQGTAALHVLLQNLVTPGSAMDVHAGLLSMFSQRYLCATVSGRGGWQHVCMQ